MNAKELMQRITVEEITQIMLQMGSAYPITDYQGNLYFTTVCHGGDSQKLLLYTDTKQFMCFTGCGHQSLFDVLSHHYGWTFKEAFQYLCQFKGLSPHQTRLGFGESIGENEDLTFLIPSQAPLLETKIELTHYSKSVLNLFYDGYPLSWFHEGITPEVAQKFDIRYCFDRQCAIIPYLDLEGNLIGIRQRNFKEDEIKAGRKYIPLQSEGICYRYPSSATFYGLYENQAAIRQYRRVILFESEKSVLLSSSYFGIGSDVSLALGGMNLSQMQRQILLDLGVETVVIALDKENTNEWESPQTIKYLKQLRKMCQLLLPYFTVEIILCMDDRLALKESPIDRGKELFFSLLQDRYPVSDTRIFDDIIALGAGQDKLSRQ